MIKSLLNSFKISIFVLQTRGKEIPDKLTEFLTGRKSKKSQTMKTNKVAIFENNLFKGSSKRSSLEIIDKNGVVYFWENEYDKALGEMNVILVCKNSEIKSFCGFSLEAFTANSVAESINIMKDFDIEVISLF